MIRGRGEAVKHCGEQKSSQSTIEVIQVKGDGSLVQGGVWGDGEVVNSGYNLANGICWDIVVG